MIADRAGRRIAYLDEGQGEPVALLHALAVDYDIWDAVASQLVSAGWRVIRPDLRGHGRSWCPPGPYSLEDFAADLAALIDFLQIDQLHLVGLSLGGMVAQAFALRYTAAVRSVVLADTTAHYPPAGRALMEDRATTAEREGMAGVSQATVARWFTAEFAAAHPELVAGFRRRIQAMNPAAYAASARAVAGVAYDDRLHQLTAPALVIVGNADQATPPAQSQELAAGLPDARLVRVPGAHLTAVESPDAFSEAVRLFLIAVAQRRLEGKTP